MHSFPATLLLLLLQLLPVMQAQLAGGGQAGACCLHACTAVAASVPRPIAATAFMPPRHPADSVTELHHLQIGPFPRDDADWPVPFPRICGTWHSCRCANARMHPTCPPQHFSPGACRSRWMPGPTLPQALQPPAYPPRLPPARRYTGGCGPAAGAAEPILQPVAGLLRCRDRFGDGQRAAR